MGPQGGEVGRPCRHASEPGFDGECGVGGRGWPVRRDLQTCQLELLNGRAVVAEAGMAVGRQASVCECARVSGEARPSGSGTCAVQVRFPASGQVERRGWECRQRPAGGRTRYSRVKGGPELGSYSFE